MITISRKHVIALAQSAFLLLSTVTLHAETYYVATTGNDSNPGTSDNPWRNPQKCAASPVQAGDTCIVRDGSYTDTKGEGIVVYASGRSPAGTASQPITIKSETPLGAVIILPNGPDDVVNVGFYISRPYYIIEGFDIRGGTNTGLKTSHSGIVFNQIAGGIARLNSFHHIATNVCTNSPYGKTGMLLNKARDIIVEQNYFYSIGRLREGENGCTAKTGYHDHGIYINGVTNVIVRRNVFYDTSRGWPIHVYGGTTTDLNIYHNTISGHSPTGKPAGHILLGGTINGATIKNNISNDAQNGMVITYYLKASDVTISNNLSDTQEKIGSPPAGVTFSNNVQESTNLGFIAKSKNDFHLSSASAAINRGTKLGVPPVKDGAPDIGAYEFSDENDSSLPAAPTELVIR
ncbi:MAG: right-handed parallel beta-helix repeat-containing protein [Nitrospira sp.]